MQSPRPPSPNASAGTTDNVVNGALAIFRASAMAVARRAGRADPWLVAYEPELRQRRLGHLQGVSNGVGTSVRDGQPTQLLPTSSIALGADSSLPIILFMTAARCDCEGGAGRKRIDISQIIRIVARPNPDRTR